MPSNEPMSRSCANCAARATCERWIGDDDPQYSTDRFCAQWKSGKEGKRTPPTDEDGEPVGVWE